MSSFVKSEEGAKAQEKVWSKLMTKFEMIPPGISKTL